MTEIGDKIKEQRLKRDLTQEQLAAEVHVTKQSVSKWENGLSIPDIVTVEKLASFFGITVDYLIGSGEPVKGEVMIKSRKLQSPNAKSRILLLIIVFMSIIIIGASVWIGILAGKYSHLDNKYTDLDSKYSDLNDEYSKITNPLIVQNMEVRLVSSSSYSGQLTVYINLYNTTDFSRTVRDLDFVAKLSGSTYVNYASPFVDRIIESRQSKTIRVDFSHNYGGNEFDFYYLDVKIDLSKAP